MVSVQGIVVVVVVVAGMVSVQGMVVVVTGMVSVQGMVLVVAGMVSIQGMVVVVAGMVSVQGMVVAGMVSNKGMVVVAGMEALVAKLKDCELQNVMQLVVRVVNFIVSRALNHRQFRELLAEYETEYGGLVMHNEVRWLSRGRVLERFSSLLPQIREFTVSKGKVEPELEHPEWIMKLVFLTDLTCHLNALNLKLQGRDKHPAAMLGVVTAFQNKITSLFIPDRQFVHFSSLKKTTLDNPEMLQSFNYDAFENALKDFIETPFNVHVSTLSPILAELCPDRASVESEIVELQANETLKAVLKSGEENFWHIVLDMDYPALKQTVQKVMCYFVSTYTCESTFSTMNIVKRKQRNRVTSAYLDILTRIAVTNYKYSMEKVKEQLAHFRSSQH
ncbi:hypothetical protein Pcinc_018599 [Petrolisthes cinctipes]|uniref:HAT C-terminal dimerisation domain-containing protein n=1 Tax=Petrolisthes cinctipes TaxID=88211 RepID=A0AAE1FMT4_PETCI|nr:hypothetical protein Pcinc_018599 [Petrolisthes cinctipes]